MKNYSKALSNQRRIAFGKANKAGKALLTGTHYLVLKNADKLDEPRTQKLGSSEFPMGKSQTMVKNVVQESFFMEIFK